MRKDHLITNLIGISFFSSIAALVLMIAFAVIRGIIGAVVPETATIMVMFDGLASFCGDAMAFSVIAMFAFILYGKICVDNSTMGDFVRLPKPSTVSSVLMYIALVGIILCAAGFLLNIIGTSSVVMFLKLTNGLSTHEAFLQKLGHFTTILSHFCKVSFVISVLLGLAAHKIKY